MERMTCHAGHVGNQHSYAQAGTTCKGEAVPLVNFQVLRRTVATHVQGMGSAKDTQTMLRHTKPDTAQISYVQHVGSWPAFAIRAFGRAFRAIRPEFVGEYVPISRVENDGIEK